MMQRNTFSPCFDGGFIAPHPADRPLNNFGGGRPVQYGPCFGAPVPQPTFQPGSCFMPASALRRPVPGSNPCNATPAPHPTFQLGSCFTPASSALRRPVPGPYRCNAVPIPAPHRYDPCFH